MNDTLVTIDKIVEWLTEQVENKLPIDAHTWIDCAQKMNVLLQGEQEKLFSMDQEVALHKKTLFDDPTMTAAKAKVYIEATNAYKDARSQKAKIERCIEMIRLCKVQARTASDLMRYQM